MGESNGNTDAQKLLIVEDDEELSLALKAGLERKGYLVTTAKDGIAGRDLVGREQFNLVISDIRMPHLSGINLLHHIRRIAGPPVILMTGFSEIIETKEAFEIGAWGFLSKPFKLSDLLTLVASALGPRSESAPDTDQNHDDDFIALDVEEFATGKEIQYEIFLRLETNRFVKIGAGGENLSHDRIKFFRSKGVQNFYLRKSDFARYLGFTFQVANKTDRESQMERSDKIKPLALSSMQIMNDLYRPAFDREKYNIVSKLVESTILVMGEQDETLNLLYALKNHSDALFTHSIAVALISALIGRQIGWRSPRTITRLIACALLHDIGKCGLPPELTQKNCLSRSAIEIELLESHAFRGKQILENVHGLPEEISTVAMQHHENCRGQGYPLRLTKPRISPLARLVSTADDYCHWAYPPPGDSANEPSVAVKKLQASGVHDNEYVKAIHEITLAGNPAPKAG